MEHKNIIHYKDRNLFVCHEERINNGVETRPLCVVCHEPTGEWNREFKQKHYCKIHLKEIREQLDL